MYLYLTVNLPLFDCVNFHSPPFTLLDCVKCPLLDCEHLPLLDYVNLWLCDCVNLWLCDCVNLSLCDCVNIPLFQFAGLKYLKLTEAFEATRPVVDSFLDINRLNSYLPHARRGNGLQYVGKP